MKRRLQLYLERTYGSAYAYQTSEAFTPPEGGGTSKGNKGRAVKLKQKARAPPDGGRFDLRWVISLLFKSAIFETVVCGTDARSLAFTACGVTTTSTCRESTW